MYNWKKWCCGGSGESLSLKTRRCPYICPCCKASAKCCCVSCGKVAYEVTVPNGSAQQWADTLAAARDDASMRYCTTAWICALQTTHSESVSAAITYHTAAATDATAAVTKTLGNHCVHRRRTGASGNYQDAVKVGAVPVTGVLEFEKMEHSRRLKGAALGLNKFASAQVLCEGVKTGTSYLQERTVPQCFHSVHGLGSWDLVIMIVKARRVCN
eukprot:2917-Heterococcus_DN1.PRE.1